jgi:hypothetical protein
VALGDDAVDPGPRTPQVGRLCNDMGSETEAQLGDITAGHI